MLRAAVVMSECTKVIFVALIPPGSENPNGFCMLWYDLAHIYLKTQRGPDFS